MVNVMDQVKIVGCRDYSFTDKNSGRPVEGTTFFFLRDDQYVTGQVSGKMSVPRNRAATMAYLPAVGDEVCVDYDRYGKPSRFTKVGK